MSTENVRDVKDVVQEKYGQAALRARTGAGSSCCGRGIERLRPHSESRRRPGRQLDLALRSVVYPGACGAEGRRDGPRSRLRGGIDVLLSARRVGPTGKAYGLDMTDEMLALAEENRRKSGLENVEFLKGEIENIPLPDNSVDVIISNCVINLSGDKDRVIKEAFRVLKPGGRFAVSDVVVRGAVPAEIRKSMELWVGCVAGALSDYEYVAKLARAGFDGIEIETTRVYSMEDARTFLAGGWLDVDALASEVAGTFISGFIRATKPSAAACCGPSCCI